MDFAQKLPIEDMDVVVRTLARRPAGPEAIMNSPTVVRALTSSRRKGQRTCIDSREKELFKMAAKASQAKALATKTAKKLRRVEGCNKGLKTKIKKVRPRPRLTPVTLSIFE